MSVTNNLKKQVDLPIFEWLRPLPTAVSAISALTKSTLDSDKSIYYLVGSTFYKYDTIGDSWQQLASPVVGPSVLLELGYSPSVGHYGRAISNGGAANTIELACFNNNAAIGKKIRIISGTGAGQERTITSVSAPIVKDRGMTTAASTSQIIDATASPYIKQWKINQYRDYQARVDFGGGATQIRSVLWNNNNTLTLSDPAFHTLNTWWGGVLATSTAAGTSFYQIESNIVTVDTNWSVQPDSTSQFVILSGGIWCITVLGTTSYALQYYDILADMWYIKSSQSVVLPTALSTDVSFEKFTEEGGSLISGTATGGSARTLINTSASLTPLKYNNFQLRITGGTGIGQVRTILANTATTFYLTRDWSVTPDNTSTYAVYRDCDKLMIIGDSRSTMYQYSIETDQASSSKQFDFGVPRSASATQSGLEPIGISSISKTTGGIASLNSTPTAGGTGYLVDQILTITTGGSSGTARVTSVNPANGAVLSVALETAGQSYTTGTGKATTVSPSGGTGCTLEILSISDITTVTTGAVHNFKIGDTVTIAGITQSEFNGSKTIIGIGSSLTFQYAITSSNSPTVALSQSATALVDISKNWVTNEHAGKILQLCLTPSSGNGGATTTARRILSNTSNTLTLVSGTVPINGQMRYVILDSKAFGIEQSIGAKIGNGTSGFATSGTTTSLTDSTKNWPINYWSNLPTQSALTISSFANGGTGLTTVTVTATHNLNVGQNVTIAGTTNYNGTYAVTSVTSSTVFTISKSYVANDATGTATLVNGRKVRIISGTGAGSEFAITSNSATTLNFLAQGFTPDTTTQYIIMENYGIASSGSTTTLVDSSQNWPTNTLVGKRVRFVGATTLATEAAITANTANTLTFALVGNAPDQNTHYSILTMPASSTGISIKCITNTSDSSLNNKYLYFWRGGSPNLMRYDLASEINEFITYFPMTETFSTGSMFTYDDADRIYLQKDSTGRIYYYDIVKNQIVPFATVPYGMGTALIGNRIEIITTDDGLKYLYLPRHSSQEFWRTLIFT